jgi:hypothetical protein
MLPVRTGALRLFAAMAILAIAGSAEAQRQHGTVQSGETPIAGSNVTLYSAGASRGASASVLGHAIADRNGAFAINYTQPPSSNAVLYLVADGFFPPRARTPRTDVRLATVLGTCQGPANVVVNERTTVATAYAMAQFIHGTNIAGGSPGLQNAAATFRNLVNMGTGQVGRVLANSPNGTETSAMAEFNSLSNLLAACVNASVALPCNALFAATRVPRWSATRKHPAGGGKYRAQSRQSGSNAVSLVTYTDAVPAGAKVCARRMDNRHPV